MTIENPGTENVAQPAQQQTPQVQTPPTQQAPSAQEMAQVISNLGSFVSPETKAEMEKMLGGHVQVDTAENQNPPVVQTDDDGGQQQQQEPAAQQQQEPPAAEVKNDKQKPAEQTPVANEYKSKFGFKKPGAKPAEQAMVIETPEQILGVVKSTFGMELKEPKELNKFFEVATGWRKDAEQFKKIEPQHKQLLDEIASLPEEFHTAFDLIAKGEDYTQAFTMKPKFDFNVSAEKQDIQALVNHYYPNEFTEEDFKEATPPAALKIAKSSALDKFNFEKQAYDSKRATVAETASKQLAAFKTSVSSSVNNLEQSFPDMEKDTIKEVSTLLEGGPQQVLSFFFEKDGSVKADTAKRLMLAMYGEEEIQGMMEIAQHSKETEMNEQLLTRGADQPKPVQRSTSPGQMISEQDKQKIEELKRLSTSQKTKTY